MANGAMRSDPVGDKLKDITRSLVQIQDVFLAKNVDLDNETLESIASALFRRATALMSTLDKDLCCSALFQPQQTTNGRAPTLLELLQLNDATSATTNSTHGHLFFILLEYLLSFLKQCHHDLHHALLGYLPAVTHMCQYLLSVSIPSRARCAVADLLKYLVKHYPIAASDIELPVLLDSLFSELQSSKCTQTAKGAQLALIGAFLRKYGSEMHVYNASLRTYIDTALEKQFSSTSPGIALVPSIIGRFYLSHLMIRIENN
jgi:hypothetical protein